jgi:hypothetical protein
MRFLSANRSLEQPPTLDSFNSFLLRRLPHIVELGLYADVSLRLVGSPGTQLPMPPCIALMPFSDMYQLFPPFLIAGHCRTGSVRGRLSGAGGQSRGLRCRCRLALRLAPLPGGPPAHLPGPVAERPAGGASAGDGQQVPEQGPAGDVSSGSPHYEDALSLPTNEVRWDCFAGVERNGVPRLVEGRALWKPPH